MLAQLSAYAVQFCAIRTPFPHFATLPHPRSRSSSKREMELVERKQMQRKAMLERMLSFTHPPRFRVYQGDGYEVRFVGNTLVINHALFQTTGSPYLS